MIAIGCATTDERAFRAGAAATIAVLDEGSSLLLRRHRYDTIDAPYNEMLAAAAARDDLEALVLVHQDAVARDEHVLTRVRSLLAVSSEVAVLGTADHGPPREAAAVGGTLLVLTPWAVANLRFDPAAAGSTDAAARDVSLQARAAGRRVVAAPLGVGRALSDEPPADRRRRVDALAALGRKWELAC